MEQGEAHPAHPLAFDYDSATDWKQRPKLPLPPQCASGNLDLDLLRFGFLILDQMGSILVGGRGFGPWRLPANGSGGHDERARAQLSLIPIAQRARQTDDGGDAAAEEHPDGLVGR